MRRRVSAIIIHNGKILLLHRARDGKEYYTTPGGGVESNETLEEALLREIKEETSLDIFVKGKLWEYDNEEYKKDRERSKKNIIF